MLKSLHVDPRLVIAIVVAGLIAAILPSWLHLPSRILCIWDSGMCCFLALTWRVMLRATPQTMRRKAKQQDEGRLVILSLITAAACASVFAIAFMLKDKGTSAPILALHLTLAAVTILGSWLLVHTIFALHYARAYYQSIDESIAQQEPPGLDFPGDTTPDYWDFLYFSFVIGMTSQVSDVPVTSRSMRRLALLHGVLSFFFNTAIVAMSINIIAGLI